MILALFDLPVTLIFPTIFELIGLSVWEKFKIGFQDGHHGGTILFGFLTGMILAVFDFQVTMIHVLPTKF